MKRIIAYIYIFCLGTGFCFAEETAAGNRLKLIPYPHTVIPQTGVMSLKGTLEIAARLDSSGDSFAAEQLAHELKNRIGGNPFISSEPERASILLTRCAADSLGREGYVLDVRPALVEIVAPTAAGIFYGVQTLRQLIRANLNPDSSLDCVTIVDRPALVYRGWQDDISRGPIPTLNYLKRQVRTLSEYKLNCMTLYTEHVFKLKKYPVIAPEDGITAAETRELIDYAKNYHVEVIGNFQSFGHFRQILKHKEFARLAETPNVLSPAFEESYNFLRDVFAEIAPAYESPLFNINCDETFGLGTGPARAMLDSLGKEGVYAYHINRINNLLKPYGKRIMMWGDIARDYPGIIPKLPSDLIVLPWGYHAADSFESDILPFTKMGFDFIVCPGVSCWNRIYPDFDTAIINISNFVRDGVRHGALGMLNTTWDDDGENLANYNWYPLIWGAEMAWHPIVPEELSMMGEARQERLAGFDGAFDPLFFRMESDSLVRAMNHLSRLGLRQGAGGLNDREFWTKLIDIDSQSHPAAGPVPEEVTNLAAELTALAHRVRQNRDVAESAAFASRRVKVLAEKTELGWALDQRATAGREKALRIRIATTGEEIAGLAGEYERLWNLENRPWWLNRNLEKYRALQRDIISTPDYVRIIPDTNTFSRKRQIHLKPLFPVDAIYYTEDGTDPDKHSKRFINPFFLNQTATVKARSEKNGILGRISEENVFVYSGMVSTIQTRYPYAPQYSAGGLIGLVDGIYGSTNFREGGYQGYSRNDFDIVIDLGTVRDLQSIETSFLQDTRSWILFPEWVEYSISLDGASYEEIAKINNQVNPALEGGMKQTFKADLSSRRAKYIRVRAKNAGILPEWHKSAGGDAWLFVDEVSIR